MNPSKIVITGTIASGKSTLIGLIKEMGYPVLSADEVNKELLEVGKINYQAIKDAKVFDGAFLGDELDKKKLAEMIFADRDKLRLLNSLTHKNILEALDQKAKEAKGKVVFIEIPLYFQMEEVYPADEVWLVTAPYEIQVDRLASRDGIDPSYAKSKIETQEDLIQMENASDLVFVNSASVEKLRADLKIALENKELL